MPGAALAATFALVAAGVEAGTPRSGVIIADVDAKSGIVTDCRMLKSTGDPIADRKAIRAFRQWRFKPNSVSKVKGPVTVTRDGIVFGGVR